MDRDVAAALVARGPAEYGWSKIAEKNKVSVTPVTPRPQAAKLRVLVAGTVSISM